MNVLEARSRKKDFNLEITMKMRVVLVSNGIVLCREYC
jgi:hypothetical protein